MTSKGQTALDTIQGSWKIVQISTGGLEVDCENFEQSYLKQLENAKIDSIALRNQFNIACNKFENTFIEYTKTYSIQKRIFPDGELRMDTVKFSIDNDMIITEVIDTEGKIISNKLKIEIVDGNYFKLVSTDETWLKLKRNDN